MRQRIDGQAVHAFIVLAASSLLLCGCTSFLRPQEKRADAQLQPTAGNLARGTVTFIERSDGVQVTYNLAGLPPNSDHALSPDWSAAGLASSCQRLPSVKWPVMSQ